MTVKRILSVVLSVMMIMASLVCVSAVSAAEITDVATNVYSVTVSVDVSSEIDGTMTAQILNAEKTELFAIGFGEKVYDSYVIELTMPEYATTGDYIVRIGGNVGAVEYEFPYANVTSLAGFYNNFIEKMNDTEALQNYLEGCEDAPVDLADYNDLLPVVRKAATKSLATVEGLVEVNLESDAVADTVLANNEIFTEFFAEVMETAAVIDVETVDEMQAVIDANDFDVYAGTETLPVEVTADEVYTYYMAEVTSVDAVEEFTVENFARLFDRATLMAVLKTKDADYLKDAFLYYEDKGSITVDMTNIDVLLEDEADGELWKKLYQKTNNTSIEKLVENAEKIADTLANGGGGGGGGGADRGDTTDIPTNPIAPGAMIDKPTTTTVTFNDLGTVEWAREAVEALAAKGVLNGKEAGRFAPNDNVTREEITKIITSAFGLVQGDAECEFADVDADRWSYVYVASASRLGIVNGYGADFGPANKTTREDMAVMIYRVLKLMNINVSGTAQNFSDSADISAYARDAVSALTSAGIINGMGDGTFAPKAYVTRAQIAKVAYELLNLAGGNQ